MPRIMKFGESARKHQGHFLTTSSNYSAAARARQTPIEKRNSHLLALGCETENLFPPLRNGVASEFFSTRGIKWWNSARSGDDKNSKGPTRNLASSQLACVNFLLPLNTYPTALASMLRTLDDDVASVTPLRYEAVATSVRCESLVDFEWLGLTSTLEGAGYTRGANATSADALIVATTTIGKKRAYLFEWKYVEEYIGAESKDSGKSGETRRNRYEKLYSAPDSPFNGKAALTDLFYEPFYQLMRLILLAAKMVRDEEFGISEARVVVVCPKENTDYRETITSPALHEKFPDAKSVSETMKKLVRDPRMIRCTTQHELADAVRAEEIGALRGWSDYMAARYERLEPSA